MIWSFLVKCPLVVVAAQQIYCCCLLDCVAPRCVCICLNLISPEFPRVHSHHSHQSHLADQDSSAAGNQVRSLDPLRGRVIRLYRGDNGNVAACRNRGERRMNALECVRRVYHMDGLRGFYRGMSASYAGISETVIHFVIYESIKRKLLEFKANSSMDEDEESVKNASDFVGMMLAAATSKTCATSIAYPHGNRLPLHIVSFWAAALKMNKKWVKEWVHILY